MKIHKSLLAVLVCVAVFACCAIPIYAAGAPTYAYLDTSDSVYVVGSSVQFNLYSDGETNTLWIYYPDGSSKYTQNAGTSISVTLTEPGSYSALVEAWNGFGSFQSERIYFQVVEESPSSGEITDFFPALFDSLSTLFGSTPMLYLLGIFVLAFGIKAILVLVRL